MDKKWIATNFFELQERVVTLSSKGFYQVFPCNLKKLKSLRLKFFSSIDY